VKPRRGERRAWLRVNGSTVHRRGDGVNYRSGGIGIVGVIVIVVVILFLVGVIKL